MLVDDDVTRLRRALDAAGMGIADGREVLVVDVEDRPGSLAELTRRLAGANVNVDLADTTFDGVRVVVATDDLRAPAPRSAEESEAQSSSAGAGRVSWRSRRPQ